MSNDSLQSPSLRFGLGGLLELVTGVGLCLALVVELGVVGFWLAWGGLIVLLGAHYALITKYRSRTRRALGCAIAAVVLFPVWAPCCVLVILVVRNVPLMGRASGPQREHCEENLRRLMNAFHEYHNDHGHFPPPYQADAQGKPMHSWRVLILPYLGEDALYQAYDLDEPWDGPTNSKLAARMPAVFHCPSDRHMPSGMTSYFCIDSPGRRTQGRNYLRRSDIRDDPTIMLVESQAARVNWLEPKDLEIEAWVAARTGNSSNPEPTSHDNPDDRFAYRSIPGFYVAMNSRGPVALRSDIDEASLWGLLSVDGGEPIDLRSVRAAPVLWNGFWWLLGVEVAFLSCAVLRRVRDARQFAGRFTTAAGSSPGSYDPKL